VVGVSSAKRATSRPRRVAHVSTVDTELAETLDSLDGADSYAGWIFALIEPFLGDHVLEVGAGHGTFTERFARKAGSVVATDLSPRCVSVLQHRFSLDPRVEVVEGPIDAVAPFAPFGSAILINVLEHIDDDAGALDQLSGLLEPGGHLVLWVPAFELLYSQFDERIGHYRRYRIGQLRALLEAAGFEPSDIRYVNPVGAVAWFFLARLLRRTPTTGRPVQLFDRYLVPILKRVEGHLRPPFGQSIFAAATKPPVSRSLAR
jgi:SAM-dependent methyltransferase